MPSDERLLENLYYTSDHEWVDINETHATVGITSYAAKKLGDIVFVDLPTVGSTVTRGAIIGEIESTKSVGELFAPLDGTVREVNDAVIDSPGLVNTDSFGEGWLIVIEYSSSPTFLTYEEYTALTNE